MSYSIHYVVAEASKKATRKGKTAKLKLVIYKTGYDRAIKSLQRSVDLISWDNNRERFKSFSSFAVGLNPLLDAMQRKLEEQVSIWDKQGKNWTPKELMSILDDKYVHQSNHNIQSTTTVEYWINYQIDYFTTRERFKNGEIVIGTSNAKNYRSLYKSLNEFTLRKYKRNLSQYCFSDITKTFMEHYCVYTQNKGHKSNNKAGLKTLKAVFNVADKSGVKGISLSVFDSVSIHMKETKTTPKTISAPTFQRIKDSDRSQLTEKEIFHLDLFLFSYYAAGMANVDVCHLNKSCLKGDHIEYTRRKCEKKAYPAFLPQMKEIIDRYSSHTYADYVLPVFNEKQQTEDQKKMKVERTTLRVNKTLKKICSILNISDKITWYSARGTYITNMLNAGVNVHEVADQAGNSPKIIEKHYYLVADRKNMLDKISAVIQ